MVRRSLALLLAVSAVLATPAARATQSDEDSATESDAEPARESAAQQSKQLRPPVLLPARGQTPAEPVNPWFVRPPFTIAAGPAADWKLTIYGFVEMDAIHDSTRSFNDGLNNGVVAHVTTQANENSRTQFTVRNSRLGFRAEAPPYSGIKTGGVLEFDLFGNLPSVNSGGGSPGQAAGNATTTEAVYFNNAAFRVRHAYVTIQDPVVDVLAGQTYYLLGWQNYFFGASAGFLGLPNELFNRTPQVRLSHTFETNLLNIDLAAGAFRPAQRDSAIPDGQAGLRLVFNHWKGISTPGSGGTTALPAALAVSAMQRAFKIDPYAPLPGPPIRLLGWAVAFNFLLPIIPAKDATDRGNTLTITGEFVTGTGDADQYTGRGDHAERLPAATRYPGEQYGDGRPAQPRHRAAGRSALYAECGPGTGGIRFEQLPAHHQLGDVRHRGAVLPAAHRASVRERQLQRRLFEQHRQPVSPERSHPAVGEFVDCVPMVAILRREPVLRRDAGDARGRVVPAGHAGAGG